MKKSNRSLFSDIKELKNILSEVGYFIPSVSKFINNVSKDDNDNSNVVDAIKFAVNSLMNDPYVILGVGRDDPDDLVDKIYKVKVKYYHTDNKDTGNVDKFIKIFNAYKRIKDVRQRR